MSNDVRPLPPYGQPAPRRRTNGTGPGTYIAALSVGFVLGAIALWSVTHLLTSSEDRDRPFTDPNVQERQPAPKSPSDAEESEATGLFKNLKDCVVNVDTVQFLRNWDSRILETQTGTGSGFVWDKQGRIVTNFHVVRAASQAGVGIRVVMADRTTWDATVVGAAPNHDLAVLQIAAPADELKPIKVGRSNELEVGQKAFAIGNPFGLSLTMTKGIISALDRSIDSPAGTPIHGVIQTDAAINPGNSGGPLLDKDGRLIGVNTSITSPSGGNVGIGFAIPVDDVNETVTELIRHGKLLTPDLGVKLYSERALRKEGPRYSRGVMVQAAAPDGPAARAGLRGIRVLNSETGEGEPGDLILAIDGQKVDDTADYIRVLAGLKIGSAAKVHLRRGTQELDLELIVRGV